MHFLLIYSENENAYNFFTSTIALNIFQNFFTILHRPVIYSKNQNANFLLPTYRTPLLNYFFNSFRIFSNCLLLFS